MFLTEAYPAEIALSFKFDDAVEAFQTTKAGKSADGKGVIKAIIDGPQ